MADRHERERVGRDLAIDEALGTEDGRARFWDEVGHSAAGDALVTLLEDCLHLEGDVIECGVYRGRSLFKLAHALKHHGATHKAIHACDSFAGFPEHAVTGRDATLLRPPSRLRRKFRMADDVPARIDRIARDFEVPIRVVRGWFSDTLPRFGNARFCFVHLDVDLHDSYRECLELLYPALVPGGVVVLDDYGSRLWPGARQAVDAFFARGPEVVERRAGRDRDAWFVRKPSRDMT